VNPESGSSPDEGAGRRRVRSFLLVLIGLLYFASVPWYRADDAPLRVSMGLPDWVTVALGCYVAIAVLNAAAWLLTEVPEGRDEAGAGEDEA